MRILLAEDDQVLADGLLRIQVIDGQLYLGPAEVAMPGGRPGARSAAGWGNWWPRKSSVVRRAAATAGCARPSMASAARHFPAERNALHYPAGTRPRVVSPFPPAHLRRRRALRAEISDRRGWRHLG